MFVKGYENVSGCGFGCHKGALGPGLAHLPVCHRWAARQAQASAVKRAAMLACACPPC